MYSQRVKLYAYFTFIHLFFPFKKRKLFSYIREIKIYLHLYILGNNKPDLCFDNNFIATNLHEYSIAFTFNYFFTGLVNVTSNDKHNRIQIV